MSQREKEQSADKWEDVFTAVVFSLFGYITP